MGYDTRPRSNRRRRLEAWARRLAAAGATGQDGEPPDRRPFAAFPVPPAQAVTMLAPLVLCCAFPAAPPAAADAALGQALTPPAVQQVAVLQQAAVLQSLYVPQPVRTPNPQIDYEGFLKNAALVGELRDKRRVSEADFLKMAGEPRTVVLDARSRQKFALMHIKGATNLPMPDFTEDELAAIIPAKSTRVLIYCNNNFRQEPRAFPTKVAGLREPSFAVSLNVHTFNQLYNYGYRNIYELAPVIDPADSSLTFAGSLVDGATASSPGE